MHTIAWLAIVGVLLLIWYLWSQYGKLYLAVRNNPTAVNMGQAVAHYATDIQGLVGAVQAYQSDDGEFSSRMGSFFAALPK